MIQSNIVNNDGVRSATIFLGESYTIDQTHPSWDEIFQIILKDDPTEDDEERLRALLAPAEAIKKGFARLTDRISVRDGHLLFDNDKVDGELAGMILEVYEQPGDTLFETVCLANFMEKLYTNPDKHSRENLFRWMKNRSFSITDEGDLVAFKGVHENRNSVNKGFAIVDGVEVNGSIPNLDGSLIEMPRSEVVHDPKVACSVGLHAGTYSYASTFAATLIATLINPRDVVSVPTDANDQKMRVCRYRVLGEYRNTKVPTYITLEDLYKNHLAAKFPYKEDEDKNDGEVDLPQDWEAGAADVGAADVDGGVGSDQWQADGTVDAPTPPKPVAKKATTTKHHLLTVNEVVDLTKYGKSWVKDHAAEIGGAKDDKGMWRFPSKAEVKKHLKKLDALA